LVIQALRLTAKGGVYLARDRQAGDTEGHVVIKQARPHIGLAADGLDARSYQPGPEADGDDEALLTVLERLCDVVGEFHSRGLVIRDLSPTNLLVDGGTVRICDAEHVAFSGTAPSPVGTPGFNPPEQRAGQAVRPPSDLYALGALLFFIGTGAPPVFAADDPPGRPAQARMADLLASCSPGRRLASLADLIAELLADDP